MPLNPRRIILGMQVSDRACILSCVLYGLIGAFGFLRFSDLKYDWDTCKGNILSNYQLAPRHHHCAGPEWPDNCWDSLKLSQLTGNIPIVFGEVLTPDTMHACCSSWSIRVNKIVNAPCADRHYHYYPSCLPTEHIPVPIHIGSHDRCLSNTELRTSRTYRERNCRWLYHSLRALMCICWCRAGDIELVR